MPFITQGKTNWKFLLIVIILAIIVGGGVLWYAKGPEKPYQAVVAEEIEILIDGKMQKIESIQLPIDESGAKMIVKKYCKPTMGDYGYDKIEQVDNKWKIPILNVRCVCSATINIDTGETECNWELTI